MTDQRLARVWAKTLRDGFALSETAATELADLLERLVEGEMTECRIVPAIAANPELIK